MRDEQQPSPGGNRGKGKAQKGHGKYSRWAKVGGGFAVRFRWRPDGSVDAQWSPCLPAPHHWRQWISGHEYRAALLRFTGRAG